MARKRPAPSLQKLVYQRARGCCEYCRSQADFATQSFVLEHIIPVARQGDNDPGNLALACQGCNAHKSAKTEAIDPLTLQSVSLFHPRLQAWRDHFNWDETFTQIIGLTPSGRATIQALCLNRTPLVRLRAVLLLADEHPPAEPD